MLNCDQALELISAKVDGALTAEDSALLEEHLAACAACRALLADFELLHQELPLLAAQPPAGLKDSIMDEVRQSKVTPFQGKKTQWRWRSLASLAAVLVLVFVGGQALRQWDGAALRTAQAPAAGEAAVAQDQETSSGEAAVPATQDLLESAGQGGRSLDESGAADSKEKDLPAESTGSSTPPATSAPISEPFIVSVAPEESDASSERLLPSEGGEVTQAEAVERLALYLGWAEDSLTADSSGTLTGPSDDGVRRTITCVGLNEAGTGWVCQVEEVEDHPGPYGTASCTSYTVPLDGSEITQP